MSNFGRHLGTEAVPSCTWSSNTDATCKETTLWWLITSHRLKRTIPFVASTLRPDITSKSRLTTRPGKQLDYMHWLFISSAAQQLSSTYNLYLTWFFNISFQLLRRRISVRNLDLARIHHLTPGQHSPRNFSLLSNCGGCQGLDHSVLLRLLDRGGFLLVTPPPQMEIETVG